MPEPKTSLNELLYEIRRIQEHREILSEKKIRKIYKSLVKDLNAFLGEYYVKYANDEGALTVAILQEKAKLAKFLEEIADNVNFFTPRVHREIAQLVDQTYKACYDGMNRAVKKAYSLDGLTDVRPEVMKRTIENNIEKLTLPALLEKHRKEIVYDIKQTLAIGLMNGDRYETMANRLTERIDISYGKATNIVRTESHRNVEGGFNDCAKEISNNLEGSGLVYVKKWVTMKDERVRPQRRYKTKSGWKTSISRNGANHIKMDGVTVKATDKFKLEPGVYAECPGMSGTARNDCRCRCFLEYDLITQEEYERMKQK